MTTTGAAVRACHALDDGADDVRLPPIPPDVIDAILDARPLELLGLA